ncbi:MAG TPA: sodium:proton antiporter [Spirochaetota bacterium]|nr:sodium:proton antiporter [Spirochaetota bacterium]
MKRVLVVFLALVAVLYLAPAAVSIGLAAGHGAAGVENPGAHATAAPEVAAAHESNLGKDLPLWSALPFAGILLSIALFPLVAPHFWHRHFPKISAAWALAFAVPFVFVYRGDAMYEILHIYIADYIPFIILLWSLFVISGGIYVKGTLKGSPAVNALIILIGTALASWIGTTGASMLLIRPIIRSNMWRKHKAHTIVFFIFLVSNIGGTLTPLGDPPLFLGFLQGVPFFWTFKILPEMLVIVTILMAVYFAMDSYLYKKEDKSAMTTEKEAISIEGGINFLFLAGVIGGVLFSGVYQAKLGQVNILGVHQSIANLIKDFILVLMAFLSLWITKKAVRSANEFSWFPIKEVAYLFAGIFMTIIPALAILKAGEQGALAWLTKAVETPAHYFWATGILSSFLDNAPTYLSFFNSLLGKFYPGMPEAVAVSKLVVEQVPYLAAVSSAAVFMGANTYIGNAPNFMVKAIAEESGIAMPSFFGYMFKYSIPVLIPIFILLTLLFF